MIFEHFLSNNLIHDIWNKSLVNYTIVFTICRIYIIIIGVFMDKKVVVAIVSIYLIMLGLNFLTPLYYGDDYVYAFIWPNQFMNIPLPETVERVSSFTDLLAERGLGFNTSNIEEMNFYV